MNPAVSQSRAIAPVAFEDGLGERLYAVGAANEPLEVLKISNELSCVSTFEEGLREQAARLADFRHEAFGRVRAVERLDARGSAIVVISDHVRGVRLSDVLAGARKRSIVLEFPAAAWLIRQLVSATAALHDSGAGVCHGAIAPERLVVTPDGRLVLVEYVLGPALEEMHFSWERYWRELGIALPRPIGLPRFDQTADVTQLAAVALALLLGRPLAADEYPHKISDVLDTATARQVNGADPLPAALRTWLRRALHIEPRAAFSSAIDAQAELDRVLDVDDATGRASLRSFLQRYASAVALERHAAQQLKPAEPAPVAEPVKPVAAPAPAPFEVTPFAAPAPAPVSFVDAPAAREADPRPAEASSPAAALAPFESVASDDDALGDDASDDDVEAAPLDDWKLQPLTTSSVTPFPTPAPFAPPSTTPSTVASVSPFVPRAATELRVPEPGPAPEPEPWRATLDSKPAPLATIGSPAGLATAESPVLDTDEDRDADRGSDHAGVPPVVAAATSGRPAWKSPWAIAGVVVLIAATTGITMLGGKTSTTPAVTASSTGTLEIGTNPDGVPVFIDGTERGMTPLTITLSPGAHVVELGSGVERRKVPVTMKAGAHFSHFIELPKAPAGFGDLLVRTDPSRATVTVDGKAYGRTPVTVKGLTAGTHKVVLENESGTFSDEVVIEPGATASLVVPLTKPQGGANVSGWIAIAAPADLQIFEGGRLVGSSRSDRIMVAVGRHDLEFVNEALGYRSTRSVDVSAGQVASVKPDWPKGSMAVNALPWAEVSIDGERIGETPIGSVSVPIGTHEIVFRHPDLGEKRTTATVTTGAATRVSMDMRAK
jgi:hypothetical protein